eukprot:4961269-Lingulodinium_polyedra.AAC.1
MARHPPARTSCVAKATCWRALRVRARPGEADGRHLPTLRARRPEMEGLNRSGGAECRTSWWSGT